MNFLTPEVSNKRSPWLHPEHSPVFSQREQTAVRQLWWLWLFVASGVFLIQAFTVDILPGMQQDEAQITDYGRLVLHPSSEWSVNWLLEERKPLMLWSYLGPLIAEVSYQAIGYHGVGPRIVSLLGGLFAATMGLGWLLSRRVPLFAAGFLSLAFLLDPLFVLSQRIARVDGWVIACCLGTCWLLRTSALKQNIYGRAFLAGILAAIGLLIWPSAIFLFPLIILELFQLIRVRRANGIAKEKGLSLGITFIIGGFSCLVILLIPVWRNVLIILDDVKKMTSLNTNASMPLQERLMGLVSSNHWFKLIKVLIKSFSPIFPAVVMLSLFYQQKRELILVTFLALAFMFATLVYEFRVLYLLPYFFVMTGTIFQRIQEGQISAVKTKVGKLALFALVFWSVGVSLFVRSYLALEGKEEESRSNLYKAVHAAIGPGKHKVFLGFTYELYFSARSLGWELYTPYLLYSYDKQGNWIRKNDYHPEDRFMELLSKMDYAVFHQGSISQELLGQLAQCGLRYQSTVKVNKLYKRAYSTQTQNRYWDICLMFLQGKKGYGPYIIYGRSKV